MDVKSKQILPFKVKSKHKKGELKMDNLKAEMQRNGLTVKDIMSTIGCSEKTARNKVNGETDFTYPEAEKVRNDLFPGLRMEYLFHRSAQPGKSA